VLNWCQSGIAKLPRKVFRLKRITPESFPLFAHYVGKVSSEIDVRPEINGDSRMPRYYGIMIDGGDAIIGNFGDNAPKHLQIPDRPTDFPAIQLPFAEEARVNAINPLYAEWVSRTTRPIVIRINDEGVAEGWFADIAE
jgi:hypothetical protein